MQDLFSRLRQLKRPRLLISAARHGTRDYMRDRHLRRIFGEAVPKAHGAVAIQLLEKEAMLNEARRAGEASYSVATHVDILVALMEEARLLRGLHPVSD